MSQENMEVVVRAHAGGDQVVARVHQVGSGIARFRAFPSFDEALEAVGLPE
jgi:hypothetical protein